MLPTPYVQSVRGREPELAGTLVAFHEAWPVGAPPATVVVDNRRASAAAAPATARQIADTFRRMLDLALEALPRARLFLFLEDDVRFAPAFAAKLEKLIDVAPAASVPGRPFAMALYRSPIPGIGNQGLVLSRSLAEYAVARWEGYRMGDLAADRRIRAIAAELDCPMPVFPLVQHVGRVSTFGNPFHFDAEFPCQVT